MGLQQMKQIVFLIKNSLRQQAKLCPTFNTFKEIEVYSGSMSNRSSANRNFYKKALDIRNRQICVFDINPFSAGTNEPSDQVLKITVKGVYLSVDDVEIIKMLKQFDLNFNSDLKYDNIRHLKTRKLSENLNGNRSIYDSALLEDKCLSPQCKYAGLQLYNIF